MSVLPPIADLVATRRSLHRVAEHVLAAALKRATGQIALRAAAGGFATPVLPDGSVLSVDGVDLVVTEHDDVRRERLSTVGAAARFAGTEPGFPWTKQAPATPFELDEPLVLDESAASLLAQWFALGDRALRRLSAEIGGVEAAPQLFPEHFDLGWSADEVNYGFSPGDDAIPRPYVYVGPWSPLALDEFWNAPFGAYREIDDVADVEQALAFLREARDRVPHG